MIRVVIEINGFRTDYIGEDAEHRARIEAELLYEAHEAISRSSAMKVTLIRGKSYVTVSKHEE